MHVKKFHNPIPSGTYSPLTISYTSINDIIAPSKNNISKPQPTTQKVGLDFNNHKATII